MSVEARGLLKGRFAVDRALDDEALAAETFPKPRAAARLVVDDENASMSFAPSAQPCCHRGGQTFIKANFSSSWYVGGRGAFAIDAAPRGTTELMLAFWFAIARTGGRAFAS